MVHGLNLDWRKFVTDQTISFFENEIVPIRELTLKIPVTTNFMADTHELLPFQALDYSKFAKHLDVISWDAYPAWHNDWESTADLAMRVGFIDDLYRCLKQKPFLLMDGWVNWSNPQITNILVPEDGTITIGASIKLMVEPGEV